MRINIIGAGPAGSYSAYLLAKQGHSVRVYERDSEIGKPIQCTGILSDHFLSILKPSAEYIDNIVTKTRIYAPNGDYIETEIKKNLVVCRKRFDQHLAKLASDAGAMFFINHSFIGFEMHKGKILSKINNLGATTISESDILIGADGPLSAVAKSAGLFSGRKFILGNQVKARKKNDNAVEFYPFIGCYAWIVPENEETVRIGVAGYRDTSKLFKSFFKEHIDGNEDAILENQSGTIPVFNPSVHARKGDIYLVGDAATFVKATTGGGINQSLMSARILSNSIRLRKDYDWEWKKVMYPNLYLHLRLHKIMQRFTKNDWNILIREFKKPSLRRILKEGSRDRIIQMSYRIITTSPGLLRFIKYA
jgi:geranylgeranyl reductase family protein